jgi:apolipoprotein N-acyltransferase
MVLPAGLLRRYAIPFCVVVGLLLLSLAWGFVKLTEEKRSDFPVRRVAMIQANFDPWSPQLESNISNEIDLTRRALSHDPDLIIWSESSVPFPYLYYLQRGNKHALRVHDFITAVKKPFIFGTIELSDTGDYYNVAAYYRDGSYRGMYRKIHLVPFGEWFPYKRLFPFVVKILEAAGAGDFKPGDEYTVFRDGDMFFNILICFEDVFGNLARKFVLNGSQLLINVTNDAWTGSEKAEIQHYSLSVFRTIENRRTLVRCANGGVTVCISPYGRPKKQLGLFISDFLICDVAVVDSELLTFYTRYGDVLPLVIVPVTLLIILIFLVKKFIDIITD